MVDVDEKTSLPKEMTLADALGTVKLAPHEIASLLAGWAADHQGGAQLELTNKLNAAAASILHPDTYSQSQSQDKIPPTKAYVRQASEPGD